MDFKGPSAEPHVFLGSSEKKPNENEVIRHGKYKSVWRTFS
jgi:hypothetical protein